MGYNELQETWDHRCWMMLIRIVVSSKEYSVIIAIDTELLLRLTLRACLTVSVWRDGKSYAVIFRARPTCHVSAVQHDPCCVGDGASCNSLTRNQAAYSEIPTVLPRPAMIFQHKTAVPVTVDKQWLKSQPRCPENPEGSLPISAFGDGNCTLKYIALGSWETSILETVMVPSFG